MIDTFAAPLDAAQIGAIFTGIAGIIIAIGGVVKIVTTRPRIPVAEEVFEQLDELRDDLLACARWMHRAVAQAATAGIELEEPPSVLRSAGHRAGERRSADNTHGWRSSVRAQTGEAPAVDPRPPVPGYGAQTPRRRSTDVPDTNPEGQAVRPAPPTY